jgi:hypothetical protein
MTALPSNLAIVGEDLARATLRDAQRSARRRRALTVSVALAVLFVTATAAVANGWLFGQTPTLRAVPALGAGPVSNAFDPAASGSAINGVADAETRHRAATPGTANAPPLGEVSGSPRTLLANLGPEHRALTTRATTTGGVCFTLTDFVPQCTPTFADAQEVDWISAASGTGSTLIWGITRDDVTSIDAVSDTGASFAAQLANNGFYAEVTDGQLDHLVVHLSDGTTQTVSLLPCPPNCPP